jgi:hypothetical protein
MRQLLRLRGGTNQPAEDDPAEASASEKQRVRDQLLGWATQFYVPGGTRLDPARAGQIADHVVVDGFSEERLWELTEQLHQDWLANPKITSPLGVFDWRLERALADAGIATRAKSKRRAK